MAEIKWDQELTSWIHAYTGDLYRWAYAQTGDKALSEDLVQDTFLAAAESKSRFDRRSQPKTWLIGILKNKIAMHYKKSTRLKQVNRFVDQFFDEVEHWTEKAVPQAWPLDVGENWLDVPGFQESLEKCMTALPEQWKACINMKYQQEEKSHVICEILEITLANYWQIMHRAKLSLRHCLEVGWFKKN
jgi:RNA polymerase sigma-70 factor (ECF subfamily)